MNKMGVGMTWLGSLPNFQHHPNLSYYDTTQCLPRRLSKKTCPHRRRRLAPPNLPPSQEDGHIHCRILSINMTLGPGEPMVKLFLFP